MIIIVNSDHLYSGSVGAGTWNYFHIGLGISGLIWYDTIWYDVIWWDDIILQRNNAFMVETTNKMDTVELSESISWSAKELR